MIHIDTSALKAALNTLKSYVTTKGTLSAILSSGSVAVINDSHELADEVSTVSSLDRATCLGRVRCQR